MKFCYTVLLLLQYLLIVNGSVPYDCLINAKDHTGVNVISNGMFDDSGCSAIYVKADRYFILKTIFTSMSVNDTLKVYYSPYNHSYYSYHSSRYQQIMYSYQEIDDNRIYITNPEFVGYFIVALIRNKASYAQSNFTIEYKTDCHISVNPDSNPEILFANLYSVRKTPRFLKCQFDVKKSSDVSTYLLKIKNRYYYLRENVLTINNHTIRSYASTMIEKTNIIITFKSNLSSSYYNYGIIFRIRIESTYNSNSINITDGVKFLINQQWYYRQGKSLNVKAATAICLNKGHIFPKRIGYRRARDNEKLFYHEFCRYYYESNYHDLCMPNNTDLYKNFYYFKDHYVTTLDCYDTVHVNQNSTAVFVTFMGQKYPISYYHSDARSRDLLCKALGEEYAVFHRYFYNRYNKGSLVVKCFHKSSLNHCHFNLENSYYLLTLQCGSRNPVYQIEGFHNEGILKVNGTEVCKDYFSDSIGTFVCRKMKYFGLKRWWAQKSLNNTSNWSKLKCSGTESYITDCQISSSTFCPSKETVYIFCQNIHLTNDGPSSAEGKVELKYKGRFGLLCAYGSGMAEAAVICRQLGYRNAIKFYRTLNYENEILLDDLSCRTNKSSINYCSHDAWLNNNCRSRQVFSVVCGNGETTINDDCSKRTYVETNKTESGYVTTPWMNPWMVRLYTTTGQHVWCAGTILNSEWILTSASCFMLGSSSTRIVLNSYYSNSHGDYNKIYINSFSYYVHPQYSNKTGMHNLALVKYSASSNNASNIEFACLADNDTITSDMECITTGWNGAMNNKMLGKTVYILGKSCCATLTELDEGTLENFYCSRHQNDDTLLFNGQSGGPLMCGRNNVYKLFGVTNKAVKPAHPVSSTLFTKIGQYKDWIDRITGSY